MPSKAHPSAIYEQMECSLGGTGRDKTRRGQTSNLLCSSYFSNCAQLILYCHIIINFVMMILKLYDIDLWLLYATDTVKTCQWQSMLMIFLFFVYLLRFGGLPLYGVYSSWYSMPCSWWVRWGGGVSQGISINDTWNLSLQSRMSVPNCPHPPPPLGTARL